MLDLTLFTKKPLNIFSVSLHLLCSPILCVSYTWLPVISFLAPYSCFPKNWEKREEKKVK